MRTDPVYLYLKRRLRDTRTERLEVDNPNAPTHRAYYDGVEKALIDALIFIEQQPRSES